MPSIQTITLFMATAMALNMTPGPSIFFILSRCLGQGRRGAIASVFGLATASVIQAFGTAFGLSALFVYSPIVFDIIKYCGAAYLIYLGVSNFLKGGIAGITAPANGVQRPSLLKSYYQGLVTDLFNPKLLLFFFAFLPQFVDVDRVSRGNRCSSWDYCFSSRVFRPISRWRLPAVASQVGSLAVPHGRVFRIGFQVRS